MNLKAEAGKADENWLVPTETPDSEVSTGGEYIQLEMIDLSLPLLQFDEDEYYVRFFGESYSM